MTTGSQQRLCAEDCGEQRCAASRTPLNNSAGLSPIGTSETGHENRAREWHLYTSFSPIQSSYQKARSLSSIRYQVSRTIPELTVCNYALRKPFRLPILLIVNTKTLSGACRALRQCRALLAVADFATHFSPGSRCHVAPGLSPQRSTVSYRRASAPTAPSAWNASPLDTYTSNSSTSEFYSKLTRKVVDRLANSEANTRRIGIVENCFGAAGQPLTIPGRVLIGEGVLIKLCRKKPKARQFFLFNDILIYGNIVIQKKKYNKQHIIPLENVTIDSIKDEGDLRNGRLIKTPTKSFAVYAATATEKSEWMNHINRCVTDLLSESGKTPINEHAAVWVPDSEATVCMRCQKAKFTPVNRRHHCRKCGFVVCGPCSEKRVLLPSQSSKPVRICDFCYDLLSTGDVATCQPARSDSYSQSLKSPLNDASDDENDDSSD
ncbi:pleckstrin homology domain-containing family F member 2-like [Erethizon dorsatum]